MRTRLALLAVLALLSACVPAEEDNDRVVRYQPDKTVMGAIQEAGVLRVGLPADFGPWAIDDAAPEGFLVDLSELVADALGVRAEYEFLDSAELLDAVHVTRAELEDDDGVLELADAEIDLAFPMEPITEVLATTRTLSDPYWVGHTRTLEVDGDAVAHDRDVLLVNAAYVRGEGIVTGPQDSTEGYGAAVRTGSTAFGSIVSQVFNEADSEGEWVRFYETWLASYFEESEPPIPTMSVEDAAALHPAALDDTA